MLSLTQLAINSLNNLDLRILLDDFIYVSEEYYQIFSNSDIVFEYRGVIEIKPNQNDDSAVFQQPIFLTRNEFIDEIRYMIQMSDFLIERIETYFSTTKNIEFIYGHRRREILASKQYFEYLIAIVKETFARHLHESHNCNLSDSKNKYQNELIDGRSPEIQPQQPMGIAMQPSTSQLITGKTNRITYTNRLPTAHPLVDFNGISFFESDSISGSFKVPNERNWKKRRKNPM